MDVSKELLHLLLDILLRENIKVFYFKLMLAQLSVTYSLIHP